MKNQNGSVRGTRTRVKVGASGVPANGIHRVIQIPEATWRPRYLRLFTLVLSACVISSGTSNSAYAQKSQFDVRKPHVNSAASAVDQFAIETDDTAKPAGGGGGGDIVVFDILGVEGSDSAKPAGSGDGDILVFDIVDSVVDENQAEARDDARRLILYVQPAFAGSTMYYVSTASGDGGFVFGMLLIDDLACFEDDECAYFRVQMLFDQGPSNSSTIAVGGYIRVKKLNS